MVLTFCMSKWEGGKGTCDDIPSQWHTGEAGLLAGVPRGDGGGRTAALRTTHILTVMLAQLNPFPARLNSVPPSPPLLSEGVLFKESWWRVAPHLVQIHYDWYLDCPVQCLLLDRSFNVSAMTFHFCFDLFCLYFRYLNHLHYSLCLCYISEQYKKVFLLLPFSSIKIVIT